MTDTAASRIRAQEYVPSLEDEMLADMLADGTDMVEACETLDLSRRQIYRRIAREPEFAELMEEARKAGYDAIASRSRKVSRGVLGFSSGDWKRDQLICKQDNWLLEKWHPKGYGQKLEVETKARNVQIPVSDDPVEAARQYADLIGKG